MREILHNERITLPEIVAVDNQSVGKSSVLEAISGIQLSRAQKHFGKRSEDEGEILHYMNEISIAVTRLTNQIAGEGTNASSTPIYLTVYKRNIPYDLTLIDLPEPQTAIVLHVIPASVDFTTSESMKLAKEFDSQCLRQLIVASKIDKYDKGIAEKLLGIGPGAMELKLGCVAVLNRNQDEIDQNISFEEMKRREAEFFIKHHEAFQHLPDEFKGIDQLKTNPRKKNELKNMPIAMTSEQDCWIKFQSIINTFRESIRAKVNEDYDVLTRINMINLSSQASSEVVDSRILFKIDDTATDSIPCDDRLAYHIYRFQRKFQDELTKSFSNFSSMGYYKLILQVIDDATGVSLPNFPSYRIIERLFHQELQRLPLILTIDSQYVRLLERLKDIIITQIDMAEDRAHERVQEMLDMEYRIFTINNLYMETVIDLKGQNKNEKGQQGEAAPPPILLTDVSPSTMKVDCIQKRKSKNDLEEKQTLKPEVLTSTVLTTSMMIVSSHKLTFDEAVAAIDIQMALESYCLALTNACPSTDLLCFMKEPTDQTIRRENLMRTIKAYEDALQLGPSYL
ncbi:unnamed protein product [Rotaria sp. Silwood1]|nr:unnamed protein product [Rotaria sp. Silwood1]